MKNYAHKIATNYKGNEQKKKTYHKEKQQRKTPKILEAFQVVKKIFNIDVYNYESKNDESEINVYSVITTCESLSENNSNAFQCNRRKRCQTQELMIESANQKNSSQIDLKQRQSNDNAVPETKVITEDGQNFEVTVFTTSDRSDKLKSATRLERKKSKMNNSQKEKRDVKKTTNKKKPYFICFSCENLIPRAIGITCQKLQCNDCHRHNQLYHSEEFLMIHKAKCHYVSEDQKGSETDSTRKEVSTMDKTDESKYYEIDVDKKVTSLVEKTKTSKKNNSGKSNKRRNNKNSIASRFRDDIVSKIAKLIRGGNYSSSRGQQENSNKHKPKHIPFGWLNDDECDTTDTSMPSPCTLSSEEHVYVVRANDARKLGKPIKNVAKRYELVKRHNKLITDNENKQKATTKYLNIGDGVSMTKEKSVSMKFLCDHPSVDRKRLAITNNIKLRVVNSSPRGEQYAESNKRVPWKTCEKSTANNSKSQPPKVSSGVHREEEKEKRPARPKEELRVMRNVNNSEASVYKEHRAISQKPPTTKDRNENNHRQMPFPHQTAPGKHFPHQNYAQPPLPLPMKEEMRPNFRPPPFACSHLQSQIPSQFRSSIKPPFINDQCCQNSLTPTLYNYNHRQCVCRDISGIPKLPWSIMVRRMENFKKINDPPTLKYSYTGNSPTLSLERNQDSPLNKNAPVLPPKFNRTASRNSRQQSDEFQQSLYLGNGQREFPQKNMSGVASNVPVMPENRHIDVFNTKDQIATRRTSNFHRARQLANNINQQFPGLMI